MKHVSRIFVVILLFLLTAFISKEYPTSGLNVGDKAPNFTLRALDNETGISLKTLKGSYVLLSFWASYDAPSRVSNAMLDHSIDSLPNRVRMVSVSFDEYVSIFNETIKQDRIDNALCFVETVGEASDLFENYRLSKGFKNYLLDEHGVIIAKNVTAAELPNYLK